MSSNPPTAPAIELDRTVTEIVVPVGGGATHDRAMPVAAWLSELWQVPIRLIHVSDSISSADPDLDEVVDAIRSWHPELPIEPRHVYGDDPAVAIAGALEAHSLAVLSTEHADGWSFKDSVAEAVVDSAGLPVILVGPEAKTVNRGGDVVVGIDGSAAAQAALAPAVELAKGLGRQLWLVQVMPEPEPGDAELHPEVGLRLQELVDGLDPVVGARWEIIHGNDPVASIGSFAARHEVSFLVAGMRSRSDETRTSMCSITMGLVSKATSPVLVIRSEPTPVIGSS